MLPIVGGIGGGPCSMVVARITGVGLVGGLATDEIAAADFRFVRRQAIFHDHRERQCGSMRRNLRTPTSPINMTSAAATSQVARALATPRLGGLSQIFRRSPWTLPPVTLAISAKTAVPSGKSRRGATSAGIGRARAGPSSVESPRRTTGTIGRSPVSRTSVDQMPSSIGLSTSGVCAKFGSSPTNWTSGGASGHSERRAGSSSSRISTMPPCRRATSPPGAAAPLPPAQRTHEDSNWA